MKNLILLFLLVSSFFLKAQNWMPFNPNDSVSHFLAEDSVQIMTNSNYGSPRYINPINSLVIDTTISINGIANYVFKKGFSFLELRDFSQVMITNQFPISKIKGRVLGDTLIVYSDSSLIKTIDSLGFKLSFPHHYSLQDSFKLGQSSQQSLLAIVQQKYMANVDGYGLDSIVEININTLDQFSQIDTSHPFNNSKCIISKNNGILSSIDFTSLERKSMYTSYIHSPEITIDSNYQMSVGDELFSLNAFFDFSNTTNSRGYYLERKAIISDSTINGYRHLTFSIESNPISFPLSQYGFVLGSPQLYTSVIKQDSTNFNFESATIELTGQYPLQFWTNQNPNVFGVCNQLGKFSLINLTSYDYNIPFSFPDSISYFSFESSRDNLEIIGLNSYFDHNEYSGGCCPGRSSSFLLYAKSGNKIWGTKPSIITSLEDYNTDQLRFYPNPTSNSLNITSNQAFNQIEIRNINGQLMLEQVFSKQVDVSELPTGVYFIKLIGNEIISQKFIKN